RDYLEDLGKGVVLTGEDIPYDADEEVEKQLNSLLRRHAPDVLFVTNSRVSILGRFFVEHPEFNRPYIIGFDFLEANVAYLAKGMVDFLICQRPDKQGYLALNYLYRYFLLKEQFTGFKPMPIYILTIENYKFYEN